LSALAESLRRFEPSWIKVGKVHRRLCFLRSEGREEEARQLEGRELAEAILEARKSTESDAEADALLAELFAEGEERVADAVAFAEVLVPMLAHEMRLPSTGMAGAAERPRHRKPDAEKPGEPREIADFIDDMLAQESARGR
jgi:hypothetical protein